MGKAVLVFQQKTCGIEPRSKFIEKYTLFFHQSAQMFWNFNMGDYT